MKKEKFGPSEYTKYERARILGARALQISANAPILFKMSKEELENINYDPIKIAELEFEEGILPITVKRPLPKKIEKREREEEKEEKKEEEEIIKKEEKPREVPKGEEVAEEKAIVEDAEEKQREEEEITEEAIAKEIKETATEKSEEELG
ncbi:MAG: DNA-directed RNA polymerase subunit K [Candidatus Pacearchaeota archaeon]|nr:MAG: DNA-directed RNA polymerase subunit K [Candidatus Pacearchaeota archaeon]